ncbi:MAG: response regulator, partial [Desulfofustis sp.]|nr:response regulator [Desulfofustis sp.]
SKELLKKATVAAEELLRKAAGASERLLNKATVASEILRCSTSEAVEELRTNSIEAAGVLLLDASKASKMLYADSAEAAQLLLCAAADVADNAEDNENVKESIAEAVESASELLCTAADNAKTLVAEAVKTAVKLLGDTAVDTELLRRNSVNSYLVELRKKAEAELIEINSEAETVMMAMGLKRLVNELQIKKLELEMQNQELQYSSAEVERLQEYFADFYDFSPTGFVSINRKGAINHTNITCAQLLGRDRSPLIGASFTSFVAMVDRPVFNSLLQSIFEEGTRQSCMLSLYDREQTLIFVQMVGTLSPDKQSCRAVLIDLTEQRQMEEQLRQAQKMEAIGQLAGGVAHDFNNMLGVILGHAEMALMKADPSSPSISNLQEIATAADRSADLTRQLLTFARKQVIAPKVLDLNDSIAGTLKMLQRLIGENIHLSWTPAANLWPLKVDPSQLDQILANLCVNARDAIAGIGKISIETGNRTLDESAISTLPFEVVPGDYVRLSVSDDGCGMDKQTQTHIFEPFYTTKEVGSGTGLGLATVYGAVKQNQGFITVYSEPGLGTVFNVYLPRTSKAVEEKQETTEKPLLRGTETVLLVEDDEMLLRLITTMLEESGYTVLAAATTELAQSFAREHAGPIHLLISDVIMPMMNGRELSAKLQPLRPDMKVLFLSGYTAEIISNDGIIDESIHFLQKPFSLEVLTTKVREVLDDH